MITMVSTTSSLMNSAQALYTELFRNNAKNVIIFGIGIGTLLSAKQWLKQYARRRIMAQEIKKLNERRSAHFHDLKQQLDDKLADDTDGEIREKRGYIVRLTLKQLIDELATDQLTAVQVLEAYQSKALEAQERTNCVCWFISEAKEWAEKLDQQYGHVSSDQKPPLFGVPVSIKESVQVAGYLTTRGYAATLLPSDRSGTLSGVATQDATIVAILKQLGAIPFCTTNVPQSLLSYTCSNPIYGTTNHPDDVTRTPGGSSGGESALVACGGSVLGIGSDVGGSVRIPAHFCGIVGLKPTSTRFPQSGSSGSIPGRPMVMASLGPMVRDVESAKIFMEILYNKSSVFEVDRGLAPLPFHTDALVNTESPKAMKIGYFHTLLIIPAVPACQRAVALAREKLEYQGHQLVPIDADLFDEGIGHFLGMTLLDGGAYLLNSFNHDIVDVHHKSLVRTYKIPIWAGKLFAPLVGRFISRPLETVLGSIPTTTSHLRANYEKGMNWRKRVLEYLRDHQIDAVVCPVSPMVTPFHATPGKALIAAGYTALFNVLDFPAMSYPITEVDQSDLDALGSNFVANDPATRAIKAACVNTLGFPVGVQIVGLPYKEETVLKVACEVDKAFGK